MPSNLFDSFADFDETVEKQVKKYSGLLGLPVAARTVQVPNRNGYVYVRLRDNNSELVQAYNDKVSPKYNLPVLVACDEPIGDSQDVGSASEVLFEFDNDGIRPIRFKGKNVADIRTAPTVDRLVRVACRADVTVFRNE